MLTPERGTEGLSSHHYYRQPLKAAVHFCLLFLATRKRVHVLLERDMLTHQIFFQPGFGYRILFYRIHIVFPSFKIYSSIFILQFSMSFQGKAGPFPLYFPSNLTSPNVRLGTNKK